MITEQQNEIYTLEYILEITTFENTLDIATLACTDVEGLRSGNY